MKSNCPLLEKRENTFRDVTIQCYVSEDKAYRRIPFEVDEDVEFLRFSFPEFEQSLSTSDVSEPDSQVFSYYPKRTYIDVSIETPTGELVGTMMAKKKAVFLSAESTSPGLSPVPIVAGQWFFIVGTEGLQEDTSLTIRVTQEFKSLRLLKGDTHIHSNHSDGRFDVHTVISKHIEQGLDFFCLTDHNTVSGHKALYSTEQFTSIPGIEVTWFHGHFNALGVNKSLKSYFVGEEITVEDRMKEAMDNGALITINHPMDNTFNLRWEHSLTDLPYHVLEIWNGPFTKRNQDAYDWWVDHIAQGNVLSIIAGSDYHRDILELSVGFPSTCVWSRSRDRKDILSAIQQGHSFLTATPYSPSLMMYSGQSMMGDTVVTDEEVIRVHLELDGLATDDEIVLLTAKGEYKRWTCPSRAKSFQVELDVPKDALFCRVEVIRLDWDKNPRLELISNPLYFR